MAENLDSAVLLVIDVQNDFCPGGRLAVKDGDIVVPVINSIADIFPKTVATMDWHPRNHVSFASNHPGAKVFDVIDVDGIDQVLWPDHCVQGSQGADFHPDLDDKHFDLILRKGSSPSLDSYSAFFENNRTTSTGLEYYLKGFVVEELFICGLATDYCVFYSAIDSVSMGFETSLIIDATKGVDTPEGSVEKAVREMKKAGVRIIKSQELVP
jgi:nicotinamidase/pyrazinamidase